VIDGFVVAADGRLTAASGSPFDAQGPVRSGASSARATQLFVSNAHGGTRNGTVSAFSDGSEGTLTSIGSSPFPDLQTAPCWVEITPDGAVPLHCQYREQHHLRLLDRRRRLTEPARQHVARLDQRRGNPRREVADEDAAVACPRQLIRVARPRSSPVHRMLHSRGQRCQLSSRRGGCRSAGCVRPVVACGKHATRPAISARPTMSPMRSAGVVPSDSHGRRFAGRVGLPA
jgi:hypothetical protein